MKIGFVTETYWPDINGVAMTLNRLVSGLVERGHSVQLICPGHKDRDVSVFPQQLDYHQIKGFSIPGYSEASFGLPSKAMLNKLWNQQKSDIIYVATEGPLGWGAINLANRYGIPVVSGFHTNFHVYSKHYKIGFLEKVIQRYLTSLHEKTLTTIVPTESQRSLVKTMGIKNVSVMGRGVDAELFSPEKRDDTLRQSWGVEKNDPVLLYVGRLAPEKNIELAIRTYRGLREQNNRLKFVFVGSGPLTQKMQKDYPDFIFAGKKSGEELAAYYASCDIFLFPSLTETFGNVVLEAMASGLGIVAFNYAAAALHVKDRQNGALATFNHPHDFRYVARLCVENPDFLTRIRTNARSYAITQSWSRIVERFEELLEFHSDSFYTHPAEDSLGEVKYES